MAQNVWLQSYTKPTLVVTKNYLFEFKIQKSLESMPGTGNLVNNQASEVNLGEEPKIYCFINPSLSLTTL